MVLETFAQHCATISTFGAQQAWGAFFLMSDCIVPITSFVKRLACQVEEFFRPATVKLATRAWPLT